MKKYFWFLLIFIILFVSSSQTYEQQSIIPSLKHWLPGEPLKSLLSTLQIPYWGRIISIEERGYYHFVEFLVRKGAHVFTFGALAIASYIMTKRFILAFIITVSLAIVDEFHQSLTGGRTPTIQDVFLDAFGAFIALLLLFLIKQKVKTKLNNRTEGRAE